MAKSALVVGRWIVRLALLCLLAAVAFAIAVLVVLPRAVHGTSLTVLTGSMSPGIPVGSVVIDRPVDPGTLRVGDVATYQKAPGVNEYITHRIVKINSKKSPTMFTFKGDANRGPDMNPVPATAVRGKVWFHVPYLGAVRDAIHTKGGIAGIGMILLAIYALFQLVGGLGDRRASTNLAAVVQTRGRATARPVSTGDPLLVLATLPTAAFDGLSPEAVSRMLRGTLVNTTATTFTILAFEHPTQAGDTIIVAHELADPKLRTVLDMCSARGGSDEPIINLDEPQGLAHNSRQDRDAELVASDV